MSAEAKVGAFTIGGIILLVVAMIMLGKINFGSSDEDLIIYAGFKQVVGLQPQADVRLSGVSIGKVANISNEGSGVTVTMRIKHDIKIPKMSKVAFSSNGVMGEKFINFSPNEDNGEYLDNGAYIYGVNEAGMNQMFEEMNRIMTQVEILLQSVQAIIGDDLLKKSVVDITNNMSGATGHINEMTKSMENVVSDNRDTFNNMIKQMESAMIGMNQTMANAEHMTSNIDKFVGTQQTIEQLKTTLDNIAKTSSSVANMAENMNKFAGDPKCAEDLKVTVSKARSISERADKILGKVDGVSDTVSKIDVTPSIDILYSGKKHDWNTNVNLNVKSGDKSLIFGAEDIGDHTRWNLQGGKNFGNNFGIRAGIIAGKIGVGLDTYAGKNLKFSAEAYDLNHGKVRLKSQLRLKDSTYLLGEWHDINKRKGRSFYLGLKYEF